jgi:hypothetical protein
MDAVIAMTPSCDALAQPLKKLRRTELSLDAPLAK